MNVRNLWFYQMMSPFVSSAISVLACKPLLVSLLTPPPDKLDGNDTYDNIAAVERGLGLGLG